MKSKGKQRAFYMSIHCLLFCIELWVDIFLFLPLICISRVFFAALCAAFSPGPGAQLLPLHVSLVGKCCLKLPSPEILLTCALNLFKFVSFVFVPFFFNTLSLIHSFCSFTVLNCRALWFCRHFHSNFLPILDY